MSDGSGFVMQKWKRPMADPPHDPVEVEVKVTRSLHPLTADQIAAFDSVAQVVGAYFDLLCRAVSNEQPEAT